MGLSAASRHISPAQGHVLLARVGYAARGIVFAILGLFALGAAIGARIRPAGSTELFLALIKQPLGTVLLCALALGLLCFAAWRLVQALADTEACGRTPAGLMRRLVFAGSALFYLGLAAWAVAAALGWSRAGSDRAVHHWTARLMDLPVGRWLVGLIGVVIVASGIGIGASAFKRQLDDRLEVERPWRRRLEMLFRFGQLARAVVFLLIGLFLVIAAIEHRAGEAKGLPGALQALQHQPYGWALLGITALGLIAFGAYQLVEAAFRRIGPAR